ncbi:hypothetical protein DZA52_01710 [Vibrio campbellii]|nr:hypothetical protein DZA52_01710 [Vibrio campbellii]
MKKAPVFRLRLQLMVAEEPYSNFRRTPLGFKPIEILPTHLVQAISLALKRRKPAKKQAF